MFAPAFSMLLLVDGFYKSCGDTLTPLRLEVFSLILNTLLNYIMIVRLNWGIRGAALATVLSRLVPAIVGLIGILRGYLGVEVTLNPWQSSTNSAGASVVGSQTSEDAGATVIELTKYSSLPVDEENSMSSPEPDENSDKVAPKVLLPQQGEQNDLKTSISRVLSMLKIGISQSFSDCMYGAVFTVMIRLAGELGEAQQAGLGAALRGLEWLAYCAGEGFLAASMTSVGQCIGAGLFKRAMDAAIMSAALSALCTGLLGVPFVIFPEQIAAIISNDASIIKYTAQYLLIVGYVMATVGVEMACYGAMVGAGQAGKIVLINGSMNLARVPIAVLCLYGTARFWSAMAWAVGITSITDHFSSGDIASQPTMLSNATSIDQTDASMFLSMDSVAQPVNSLGPPSGTFACICWVVAGTAVMKAVVYTGWMSYRVVTKTYFSDSRVIS
jgi:hypothetical protein